jgi:hypothetical protein
MLAGPALWLALVAIFVALWQVSSSSGYSSNTADDAAAPDMWRSVLAQYAPLLGMAVLFGLFYWRFHSFAKANKRGVDLMSSGNAAAAADAFRRLARKPLAPAAVARFNLGLALLRMGDLQGALDAFADAERRRPKALRPAIADLIALCNALTGDLAAADGWLVEARQRAASACSTSRIHFAADAIVLLRRGNAAAAATLLDGSWGELERCTAADLVRAFRLVRAFAAEQVEGAAAAQAADLLAGARPFRAGEYAWIAARWPEMARYLAANGFEAAA